MFKPFRKRDKRTKLEKEIDDVLNEMIYQDKSSKEYAKNVEHLERLYKAKGYEKPSRISPDTMLIVAANLLGIILILKFEKLDTITSRAVQFVLKGRV